MPSLSKIIACALLPLLHLARGQAQGALETLPYNFTLAAINTTLPNSNSTGAPLVLGAGGATGGVSIHITSTYSSFPYNDYPSLGLVNKALRAFSKDGGWYTNATAVNGGESLTWITSTLYPSPEERNRVYEAVEAPALQYPLLSAQGFTNLWSLCPQKGNRPQTMLIFNVSAVIPAPAWLSFDPEECYGVTVNILPVA